MTTTPPAGSEKWTAEQREVWRRIVGAETIKALPPEMREAFSAFAACLVETPYPFVTDWHRGAGDAAGRGGGNGVAAAWFNELFRRYVAEEEARLLRLALQCFAKAVVDRKPDPPPTPTLLGSLDDLVSALLREESP